LSTSVISAGAAWVEGTKLMGTKLENLHKVISVE
jgi:hypothetical protein